MEGIEIYTFFLCLIVFVLLTGVFTFFIVSLMKMGITLMLSGHDDEAILKERNNTPKKSKLSYVENAITLFICVLLILTFIFSIVVNLRDDIYFENIPTINVVNSGSMSKKNKKNTYLTEYNLNDQFSTFDVILIYKVPPASELKRFDIVLYETDNMRIIHRIIDIEPPNAVHPEEYWFTCKGDSNESIDRFPVRYDQIKGIYKGERIPFIGSFISFLQSPAGILCIILVLFGIIAIPIAEKKLLKAREERYEELLDIIAESKREKQEAEFERLRAAELEAQRTAELEKLMALAFGMQKSAEPLPHNEEASTALKSAISEEAEAENTVKPFAHLIGKNSKTFRQKLRKYKDARIAFTELKTYIDTFEKTRLIESDRHDTFKRGSLPVARFAIRGKTLYTYLALPPAEYTESKYIFTDVSEKSAYKNYPMLVKITSQRQLRWARELIDEIAKRGNMTRKALSPSLTQADIEKAAEELLKELYEENADEINARHAELDSRHEKLNARHSELDSRHEKLNARQAELDSREAALKSREEELERKNAAEKSNRFAHLATKNPKTFRQKLRKHKEARLAFNDIKSYIEGFEKTRLIESDRHDTFKCGNLPLARFTIRGKTLYAYLALPPNEYIDSKYVFTDVSEKSAYKNYPMLVKLTSQRQLRWIKELIDEIAKRGDMIKKIG